jgi:hypothetical protein
MLKCDNGVPCAFLCSGTGSDGDIGVSELRRVAQSAEWLIGSPAGHIGQAP